MRRSSVHGERVRTMVVAVARHQAKHGYAPSVRELRAATGLSSISEVARWLGICEREGLLVRAPGLARAITLTEAGRVLAGESWEKALPAADRRVA